MQYCVKQWLDILFCPRFKSLNEKTHPLVVTLPCIEDNLLLLANSKFFSAIDFSQGYFHLKVHKDSLKSMYCACPNYFIQYQYMTFGLHNAGSFFSLWIRNLHQKLPLHLQKSIVCYLDDLLIHTPSLERHMQVLEELFPILKKSGVVLNSPKCEFIKAISPFLVFQSL